VEASGGASPEAAMLEEPAAEWTLERLEEKVALDSPELRAAFEDFRAKLEQVPQASSLPDPMLSYARFVEGVQTRTGEQEFLAGLSQKFFWPGKRERRAEMASAEAMAALEAYRALLLDKLRDARKAWHELAFERAAEALVREERQYLESFVEAAAAAYASGQKGRQSLLKAQAELARSESELLGFPSRTRSLEARLGRLMGRPASIPIIPSPAEWEAPEPAALDSLDWTAEAKARRPELARADRLIEKAERALDLARLDYRPDLTAGLNYIGIGDNPRMDPPDEGDDAWNAGFAINIPVPNARRRAAVSEAEKRVAAAKLEREAIGRAIEADLADALGRLRSLEARLAVFRGSLLPLAEEAFAASQSEYLAGQGLFIDLLDAERSLIRVRLEGLRIERDYWLALADLERAAGVELIMERRAAQESAPAPLQEEPQP
jgi:outer membrane protein TolC